MTKNDDPMLNALIARVSKLIALQDFEEAQRELTVARAAARNAGNLRADYVCTSLLASCLAEAGDDEGALSEWYSAEGLAPTTGSAQAATAAHLFRMKRFENAFAAAEESLAKGGLDGGEKHLLFAMLGKMTLRRDVDKARSYLANALDAADAADLEPAYWDVSLAEQLARQNDAAAERYLRELQSRASVAGELVLAAEIRRLIDNLLR